MIDDDPRAGIEEFLARDTRDRIRIIQPVLYGIGYQRTREPQPGVPPAYQRHTRNGIEVLILNDEIEYLTAPNTTQATIDKYLHHGQWDVYGGIAGLFLALGSAMARTHDFPLEPLWTAGGYAGAALFLAGITTAVIRDATTESRINAVTQRHYGADALRTALKPYTEDTRQSTWSSTPNNMTRNRSASLVNREQHSARGPPGENQWLLK